MESTSGRLSEDDLRGHFSNYGEVEHAVVLSDEDGRGFGCVTFTGQDILNVVLPRKIFSTYSFERTLPRIWGIPTNGGALDLLVSIQRKLWKGHCRMGVTNWQVGLWRLRGLNLKSMGNDYVNDKWKESDNQSSLILDMIHWYNWHPPAGVLYGDIQTSIYHCQS